MRRQFQTTEKSRKIKSFLIPGFGKIFVFPNQESIFVEGTEEQLNAIYAYSVENGFFNPEKGSKNQKKETPKSRDSKKDFTDSNIHPDLDEESPSKDDMSKDSLKKETKTIKEEEEEEEDGEEDGATSNKVRNKRKTKTKKEE